MDCPTWTSDSDEHVSPECFQAIEAVVEDACRRVQSRCPTRGDIAQWHRAAFREVVPLDYYAGHFRQEHHEYICLGINVGVDNAPGFTFRVVVRAITQLCEYVDRELAVLEVRWSTLSPADRVQRIAMVVGVAVGRFVHIHPFINGNGRISRVLWTVLLARLGLPRQLSVLRRPGAPYGDVMQAAMRGDYGPAVAVVLQALRAGPAPPKRLTCTAPN